MRFSLALLSVDVTGKSSGTLHVFVDSAALDAGITVGPSTADITVPGQVTLTITAASNADFRRNQITVGVRDASSHESHVNVGLLKLGIGPRCDSVIALGPMGTFTSGAAIATDTTRWRTSDTSIVTLFPATGPSTSANARANGTATITARLGTGIATVTCNIKQIPNTLTVTPGVLPTLSIGQQVQLTAVATDRNGRVVTGWPLVWSSDNPVASVTSSGLVTARIAGPGQLRVTAVGTNLFLQYFFNVSQ